MLTLSRKVDECNALREGGGADMDTNIATDNPR